MIQAAPAEIPELLVVVDTEEEFDWGQPFSRANVGTRSIPAQAAAHDLFDRLGVVPTYVVDYPVATDPVSVAFLRQLKEDGRAEIGAHLHTWVTPPFEEEVTTRNTYQCNLPLALKRAKIEAITDAVATSFGEPPRIFKAGRYGFGPHTRRLLPQYGYQVDCSVVPYTNFSADGGPDFRGRSVDPHWLDTEQRLLELPVTVGYVGRAANLGRHVQWLFDAQPAIKAHLPGLLARSKLLERVRLSPEGHTAEEQIRLLNTMVAHGHRTFSLTYHSPSLEPGNTPYVRTAVDLCGFLGNLETVLSHFRETLGGRFTTPTEVHSRVSARTALAA